MPRAHFIYSVVRALWHRVYAMVSTIRRSLPYLSMIRYDYMNAEMYGS